MSPTPIGSLRTNSEIPCWCWLLPSPSAASIESPRTLARVRPMKGAEGCCSGSGFKFRVPPPCSAGLSPDRPLSILARSVTKQSVPDSRGAYPTPKRSPDPSGPAPVRLRPAQHPCDGISTRTPGPTESARVRTRHPIGSADVRRAEFHAHAHAENDFDQASSTYRALRRSRLASSGPPLDRPGRPLLLGLVRVLRPAFPGPGPVQVASYPVTPR
jgi:hypothetical protein